MKYLYAGRLFWFKQIWTSFGWNPQGLLIYLLGNLKGGPEKVAKFVGWNNEIADQKNKFSVVELKLIEILKTLRYELQLILKEVCEAGFSRSNRSKKKKCDKSFSNKLNKI